MKMAPQELLKKISCFCLATGLSFAAIGCRQDMHDQPKFVPQRGTTFFADGRSARPQVNGTVARSQGDDTSYFMTGMVDRKEADGMPLPVTMDLLQRGEERYNIYCTPCHSRVGNGKGRIVQRGYYPAADFHSERLRQAPLGHFFNVITNGYGIMPNYAAEVRLEDRWAIVAYIRALQLSQHAKSEDAGSGAHALPLEQIAESNGFPPEFANSRTWNGNVLPPKAGAVPAGLPSTAQPKPETAPTTPPPTTTAATAVNPAPTNTPGIKTPVPDKTKAGATEFTSTTTPKPDTAAPTKPTTAATAKSAAAAGDTAAGEKLFLANCAVCHQPTRAGLPPVVPSLINIVPRVGEATIRDKVTNGIPTGKPPMPAFGDRFSASDFDNLIAFLKTAPK